MLMVGKMEYCAVCILWQASLFYVLQARWDAEQAVSLLVTQLKV